MKTTHAILILQAIADSQHGLRLTEIVATTRLGIVQVDTAMGHLKALRLVQRAPVDTRDAPCWQITRAGLSRLNATQAAA
jgi:DNA-binding IclR family transcriptional regulator